MVSKLKLKERRNERQAIRQKKLRDEARELRKPTRDDIARVLLWHIIMKAHKQNDPEAILGQICGGMCKLLNEQGFNPDQTERVFYELADKYKRPVAPFRMKRHLGV